MQVKQELNQWFSNAKGDVLAGLVSSFAVIPEVVGFCIVAGISPMMGLYASFWLTVLMAFIGGRPAMFRPQPALWLWLLSAWCGITARNI